MISFEDLLEKLLWKKDFNPFHQKFNKDLFLNFMREETNFTENDLKSASTILFIALLNPDYKLFYHFIQKEIVDKALAQKCLFWIISFINHDSILANKEYLSSRVNEKQFDFFQPNKFMLNSCISSKINYQDLSNILLDHLNFSTKFITYSSKEEVKNEKIKLKSFFPIFLMIQNFSNLKNIYDQMIFEDGYCEVKSKTIYVKFKNKNEQMLKHIGAIRLNSIIMEGYTFTQPVKELLFTKYVIPNMKLRTIKKILFTDNSIEFELAKHKSKIVYQTFLYYTSTFHTFFPHINDFTMQFNKCELSIYDFILMFSILNMFILKVIENINFDDEYDDTANEEFFERFNLKVKKVTLLNLFLAISNYNKSEIICFLRTLYNDFSKDFWIKPLLNIHEDYYIVSHAFTNCNILNFIDNWLIEYGSEKDKDGKIFENYLKVSLSEISKKKNFFYNILPSSKFKFANEFEEIDLIYETKNTIIIAEVKCIRFPFSSRIHYSTKKKLNRAAVQIKRKANFLRKHKDKILNSSANKKPIYPCIIINYPLFSGYIIDEIPVVDWNLLRQYVNLGYSAQSIVQDGSIKEIQTSKVYYYKNESEFSNNLPKYLLNPYLLNLYKERLHFTLEKSTNYANTEYDILIESTDVN